MGRQDSREKQAVERALRDAWEAWTAGLELQLKPSTKRRQSTDKPGSNYGESEEDFAQLQQERLMAMDDFDPQENRLQESLEANLIDHDLVVNQGTIVLDLLDLIC